MKTESYRKRLVEKHLPHSSEKRIIILTGARQTGKTTLAKSCYGDMTYLNLDAAEYRDLVSQTSTLAWSRVIGNCHYRRGSERTRCFRKDKIRL